VEGVTVPRPFDAAVIVYSYALVASLVHVPDVGLPLVRGAFA